MTLLVTFADNVNIPINLRHDLKILNPSRPMICQTLTIDTAQVPLVVRFQVFYPASVAEVICKSAKILIAAIIPSVLLACQSAASQGQVLQNSSNPTPMAVVALFGATTAFASAQAILQAPDPSSAIQAYSYARINAPTDLAIEQAFVHRMVSFGLPEMADMQAADIIQHRSDDGVAWAVAAYMYAKRDQMTRSSGHSDCREICPQRSICPANRRPTDRLV